MLTVHEQHNDLAKELGLSSVYFKREDLHPYGSHKGRSIPVMINKYIDKGIKHFAISSSGNAALAAGMYIKELNNKFNAGIMLEILAGKNINLNKLKKLEDLVDNNILLSLQDRPLQALFIKTQDPAVQSLRQSNDDLALEGYGALAMELLEIPDLKAVFIGTSSGTAAQALAQFFQKNKKDIEINIVQTTSCHPIAREFFGDDVGDEKSIADAIVDTTALRKDVLVDLIKKSGGNGWIATNEQIESARELSEKYAGLKISPNSALSVSGLMQAAYTGKTWSGSVVCMICGE